MPPVGTTGPAERHNLAVGNLQIVIAALFVSAAGLNALANWLKVPYPSRS